MAASIAGMLVLAHSTSALAAEQVEPAQPQTEGIGDGWKVLIVPDVMAIAGAVGYQAWQKSQDSGSR
eukprot:CAMPEP_0183444506 /NCGR_PEP_ID=MMETSP0370-20130417/95293_1 /TAXON_ID=268820 /ORGANISM="Peridinium aciculiferum, Strain PAER-2" /LENGTH=66 /DNA_ID=CAMNT_0025634889 /DNA_START=341 /DNA_END=541 /DNA_ORIENTATION=+